MKALVLYDTNFGNTKVIAETIVKELWNSSTVLCIARVGTAAIPSYLFRGAYSCWRSPCRRSARLPLQADCLSSQLPGRISLCLPPGLWSRVLSAPQNFLFPMGPLWPPMSVRQTARIGRLRLDYRLSIVRLGEDQKNYKITSIGFCRRINPDLYPVFFYIYGIIVKPYYRWIWSLPR